MIFFQELRKAFDEESRERRLLLSVTVGVGEEIITKAYEIKKLARLIKICMGISNPLETGYCDGTFLIVN